MSHGVHEIEAWLSVDGTDVESEHIVSQVMVVSDPDNKTPYIMLNQIVKSLVNWTSVQFFQWAIYNPGSDVLLLN